MGDESKAWLETAHKDLLAAQRLSGDVALSGVIAFHAQQAVEKALKATLIVQKNRLLRTHDLKRLLAEVEGFFFQEGDEDTLFELSALYTQSRYPADFGLLPSGRPGEEDLKRFIDFAERICEQAGRLTR